jgi:hypothetical protein
VGFQTLESFGLTPEKIRYGYIDELLGRSDTMANSDTSGLQHFATACAIEGTAQWLALRYSHDHLRKYRRTHSLPVMTTGRTELFVPVIGTAAATVGVAGPFGDYWPDGAAAVAGRVCLSRSNNAASGLHDHATLQERANASVLCTGLGANYLAVLVLAMADEAQAGWFIV